MAPPDPLHVAKELLGAVVQAGASRHVAAAVSCALLRTVIESDKAIHVAGELVMHETLAAVVEEEISSLRKLILGTTTTTAAAIAPAEAAAVGHHGT